MVELVIVNEMQLALEAEPIRNLLNSEGGQPKAGCIGGRNSPAVFERRACFHLGLGAGRKGIRLLRTRRASHLG